MPASAALFPMEPAVRTGGCAALRQARCNVGHKLVDGREAFDPEQFGHRNRPRRRHARQVVADQVDDHQIFGALFRGLQASIRERRERDERIRRYARKRPPRRKPPAAGIAAPAVPPIL